MGVSGVYSFQWCCISLYLLLFSSSSSSSSSSFPSCPLAKIFTCHDKCERKILCRFVTPTNILFNIYDFQLSFYFHLPISFFRFFHAFFSFILFLSLSLSLSLFLWTVERKEKIYDTPECHGQEEKKCNKRQKYEQSSARGKEGKGGERKARKRREEKRGVELKLCAE